MKPSIILAALLLASITAGARPYSVQCPLDGWSMYFDHQAGEGQTAICWYSHYHNDIGPDGKMVSKKHDYPVYCSHP